MSLACIDDPAGEDNTHSYKQKAVRIFLTAFSFYLVNLGGHNRFTATKYILHSRVHHLFRAVQHVCIRVCKR